jgi:hypothetical protein
LTGSQLAPSSVERKMPPAKSTPAKEIVVRGNRQGDDRRLGDAVARRGPGVAVVDRPEDSSAPRPGKDVSGGVDRQRGHVRVRQAVDDERPRLPVVGRSVDAATLERAREDVAVVVDRQRDDERVVQPVVDRRPAGSVVGRAEDSTERPGEDVAGGTDREGADVRRGQAVVHGLPGLAVVQGAEDATALSPDEDVTVRVRCQRDAVAALRAVRGNPELSSGPRRREHRHEQ